MEREVTINRIWFWICALAAGAAVSACGGGASNPAAPAMPPSMEGTSTPAPITHIVVMVQENRTFNDLFATFPGAIGTTTGKIRTGDGPNAKTESIELSEVNLEATNELRHTYPAYRIAYRGGAMDAFNLITYEVDGQEEGKAPYQYVNPNQIQPYWTLAKQYGLSDKMFQTQGSGSFTAHQDLIAGATAINATHSLIDDPTKKPWGCPAPPGTVTSLITTSGVYQRGAGPPPCVAYDTLQKRLDAKSISWKYYTPAWRGNTGGLWNAFLAISSVYNNATEWSAHISQPETNIFNDISGGSLPAMSWVIPDGVNSDHPAYASDTGPSWVASVVNAIGQSSYWNSTVIIILWDDWGGFYDPVKPPKLDHQGGPGFRVPMIIVSPYVPQNKISNTVYEFGSILRFIEDKLSLGRLGTTDQTCTSIANMFDFKKSPRPFHSIPSKYSRSFFLRQAPSGLPVDTE
jgi:phospholipase C